MLTVFETGFFLYTADHPWLQNIKKAPDVPLGESVRARLQQFSVMNKFKKRALRVIFCCMVLLIIFKYSEDFHAYEIDICNGSFRYNLYLFD